MTEPDVLERHRVLRETLARAMTGAGWELDPATQGELGDWDLGHFRQPIGNAFSRRIERQADDFALGATADPDAFVGAMERLAALNLAERRPHPVKEFMLYSHPAIHRRIARARM